MVNGERWEGKFRYEISGPLEYHIQRLPSSLHVVPYIIKPVLFCIFTVQADENWLENEKKHIQERRESLNMILERSRDFKSGAVVLHN